MIVLKNDSGRMGVHLYDRVMALCSRYELVVHSVFLRILAELQRGIALKVDKIANL